MCPGEIGIISRKARTWGVERIRWHWGSTFSGSGEVGTGDEGSAGYAALMLQKAQGIGYRSSTDMIVGQCCRKFEDRCLVLITR